MGNRFIATVLSSCLFLILVLLFPVPPHTVEYLGVSSAAAQEPEESAESGAGINIEAAIINPYQSANVGTEVSGIIEMFRLGEGEFVEKGKVVAEVSKRRFQLLRDRSAEALKALELSLTLAQRDHELKSELLALEGTTKTEVLKALTEVEVAKARVKEAQTELKLAELNLEKCQVEAPFSGYIAVKYKQPFEPVERLEKIFAIVDSSKVYAVANLADTDLDQVKIGDKGVFVYRDAERFTGEVEKIGKLIDPKSNTKRVFVTIDNADGALEVGMTGVLQLARPEWRR
ncbi:MAG: efflux RND transporter periplasmic adaptor subunit [Desulfomonilaceae bacterium]|nr:efflux RND transporter periplasmic adaptor subunit [Desulfomonilaceae bacterium]